MLLRMLCFLEWCSIIMMNRGSSLSIMCFSGAGIYFSVFRRLHVSLSVAWWLMSPVTGRNTQSVVTRDGSLGHLWDKITDSDSLKYRKKGHFLQSFWELWWKTCYLSAVCSHGYIWRLITLFRGYIDTSTPGFCQYWVPIRSQDCLFSL